MPQPGICFERLIAHTSFMKFIIGLFSVLLLSSQSSYSQAGDPKSSSKSSAQYDAASISNNIAYNRDVMYLSRLAGERGTKTETIEEANEMLTDFTELLYSFEQLETSAGNKAKQAGVSNQAVELNDALSQARGFSFDTTWLGGMLRMHQEKFVDLTSQKENATDSRLKTSVTQAMPILRRHITKLNSLQKQLVRKNIQEKKEAAKQREREK